MDLLETMRTRRSVRTYISKQVPEGLLDGLLKGFASNDRLNDLPVKLLPMPSEAVHDAMTGLVGSYGSIRNAPLWVIGITREGAGFQENFGFRMEQFILECTLAGLGTCWVGGFFKLSMLDRLVPKGKDERIVCISPVGYAAERRLGEKTMRSLGGLNARKPLAERVFLGEWGSPSAEYLATRNSLQTLFEMARWAPSASNRQPCHYVLDGKRIVISVLTSLHRSYPKFLMSGDGMSVNFQPVDAGIAMAHVHLASRELGMNGSWSLEFDEPAARARYQIPADARIVGIFTFSG
ncbi:MAG: nitroreductase family protein [Spirochaetes bacterium]|nr:nitroreductase family protein [Spirochaetota bacterium]